jgi:hypothetical protein
MPSPPEEVTIDVGRDFSMTPGGRFMSEGEFSGEEFRKRFVEPALDRGCNVVIDLDSAEGFTTSFLEEVFGGLVRKYGPMIGKRIVARSSAIPTRAAKARMFLERAGGRWR